MKDNLLEFYLLGVLGNLILIFIYIRATTRRFSGNFKKNLSKINVKVDLFGNVDGDLLRFTSSLAYVLINIFMSWVFVPFNIIILFVRIYSNYSEDLSNEIKKLNEKLKVSDDLSAEEVFVLFQLCDKSIIPNVFCKAEIMDNLSKHNETKSLSLCSNKVENHLDSLIKVD